MFLPYLEVVLSSLPIHHTDGHATGINSGDVQVGKLKWFRSLGDVLISVCIISYYLCSF